MARAIRVVTRTVARAGVKAVRKSVALRTAEVRKIAAKTAPKSALTQRTGAVSKPMANMLPGLAGSRRYWLYQPPGIHSGQPVPLLVMLHGCTQSARSFAATSGMNAIAAREGFMVLYPEQDRAHNLQGCWNWFDTRNGRAQREADAISAAISQVCLTHAVDARQIAIAGFSAGAGMAALLATREPLRFKAVIMHSGIGPGVAQSSATALSAMRGRRTRGPLLPLQPLAGAEPLPALLVIQGTADSVVALSSGRSAAERWAAHAVAHPSAVVEVGSDSTSGTTAGKKAGMLQPVRQVTQSASPARTVQRGNRRSASVTDYCVVGKAGARAGARAGVRAGARNGARTAATLCEIEGLGHGWSGGAPGQPYSDAKGPDASRMIWAFIAKQFTSVVA